MYPCNPLNAPKSWLGSPSYGYLIMVSENYQVSNSTEDPDSEHNQNSDLANTEDTQCEIPQANIPSNIWLKTEES